MDVVPHDSYLSFGCVVTPLYGMSEVFPVSGLHFLPSLLLPALHLYCKSAVRFFIDRSLKRYEANLKTRRELNRTCKYFENKEGKKITRESLTYDIKQLKKAIEERLNISSRLKRIFMKEVQKKIWIIC